jgi:NADH-quinone oxidoreductase subunit G
VVVQELFLTETARRADVVFPAQSFAEREGTFTSGERRVQRFYPVIYPVPDCRADFVITAQVARRLGHALEMASPAKVFLQIASEISLYRGLTYPRLAEVEEQWPPVGRSDLYYGGTAYDNRQGMGVALPALCQQQGWQLPMFWNDRLPERTFDLAAMNQQGMVWLVPFNRLYDRGTTVKPSQLLEKRMVSAHIALHPETARAVGLSGVEKVQVEGLDGPLPLVLDETLPQGVAFYPRSAGVPVLAPRGVKLHAVKAEVQEG